VKAFIQSVWELIPELYAYAIGALKETGRAFYICMAVLMAIMLFAGYNWLRMLSEGAGITGSSDFVPWGIFIVGFIFFVGVSAGSTIIGLMIYAFDRKDYKPIGSRAIVMGLVSLAAATMMLVGDVGVPWRTLKIPFILRNMTSMLIYTSSSYMVFGAILTGELFFALRIAMGSTSAFDKKMVKWLAISAMPVALMILLGPDGALFAVVKAREYWHNPLLPPHFAMSALVTGTAFMILITILTSKLQKRELLGMKTLTHMGTLLGFFISVNLFFDFFDLLILRYSDEIEGVEMLNLLTGRFSPFFALNYIGLFGGLLILLSKKGRETKKGLTLASLLAVLGIMNYRYYLVVGAQLVPLQPAMPEVHYIPTFPETAVAVGIVAVPVFLYSVLTKFLPMEPIGHKTAPDRAVEATADEAAPDRA
jgi:molybdopterin-containing oxidoreductase family membrane subunit